MKKLLTILSTVSLLSTSGIALTNFNNNEQFIVSNNLKNELILNNRSSDIEEYVSQVVLQKPHNINEERRVNAGTSAWVWEDTSDDDTYLSDIFEVSLAIEANTHPTFFNNLMVEFDFKGSMVDIHEKKLELAEPIKKIYFADFQNQTGTKELEIGYKESSKNKDYVRGTYSVIYSYDKDTKVLKYQAKMYSYAYNGGNGNINTHGKGTNKIRFNNVKFIFDNDKY